MENPRIPAPHADKQKFAATGAGADDPVSDANDGDVWSPTGSVSSDSWLVPDEDPNSTPWEKEGMEFADWNFRQQRALSNETAESAYETTVPDNTKLKKSTPYGWLVRDEEPWKKEGMEFADWNFRQQRALSNETAESASETTVPDNTKLKESTPYASTVAGADTSNSVRAPSSIPVHCLTADDHCTRACVLERSARQSGCATWVVSSIMRTS